MLGAMGCDEPLDGQIRFVLEADRLMSPPAAMSSRIAWAQLCVMIRAPSAP